MKFFSRSLDENIDNLTQDFCPADVAMLRQRAELVGSQWEELRNQTQQRRSLIEARWVEIDFEGPVVKSGGVMLSNSSL